MMWCILCLSLCLKNVFPSLNLYVNEKEPMIVFEENEHLEKCYHYKKGVYPDEIMLKVDVFFNSLFKFRVYLQFKGDHLVFWNSVQSC